MTIRTLAAAALVVAAAATPALASGLDSRHSPFPPAAYSGYAGYGGEWLPELSVTDRRAAPAYRYAGPHAGGPANDLRRY